MASFDIRLGFVFLCLLFFQLPSASANNNWLLPGDAFFPTVLTQADILALQANLDERYEFHYSNFDTFPLAFCGNAGFQRVVIESVDKAFVANLAAAYKAIRETQPRELVEELTNGKKNLKETNGIRVLFYPEAFDFSKHKLGLRYNENWVEELVKAGYQRDHVRLCCMLSSRDAVMVSWRDAKQVAALELTIPKKENPAGETSRKVNQSVVVKGKVKAIVILAKSLDEYFKSGRDDSLSLYEIDSTQYKRLSRQRGKWVSDAVLSQERANPFN